MSCGVQLWTAYSGIDSPGHAAAVINEAMSCSGVVGKGVAGFTNYCASECDKKILQFLTNLSKQEPNRCGPQHVFGSLESSLSASAAMELFKMASAEDSARADANLSMGNFLTMLNKLSKEFTSSSSAECLVHKRQCFLFPQTRPPSHDFEEGNDDSACSASKMLRFHVAGPTCKDWSRRGKGLGLAGESRIPFAIWFSQVLASDTDVALHEATVGTREDVLSAPLTHCSETDSFKDFFAPTNGL